MRPKRVLQMFLLLLLLGAFLGGTSLRPSIAIPGDSADPLVTKSWVNDRIGQEFGRLEKAVVQVRQQFARLMERKHVILFIGSTAAWVNTAGVDYKKTALDVAPLIKDGCTFLPIRFLSEALAFSVDWNGETQTVTCASGSRKIVLTVGSLSAIVDGQTVPLAAAPFSENGRVMVPLRFISEAFGCQVLWDGEIRRVDVIKM